MPLPPIFNPIVNASKPQKIVLGVVGLAIIGAAANFLVLSPLGAAVDQLSAGTGQLDVSHVGLHCSRGQFPQPP